MCILMDVCDVDTVNYLHVTVVVVVTLRQTDRQFFWHSTVQVGPRRVLLAGGGSGTAGGYVQYVHAKQDSVIIYGYRSGGTE